MRRRTANGFTLIEVLVAIVIVATVMIVLIYRRVDVVQDAAKIRDQRIAWSLVALKLGDMSRDPLTILDADSGDFSEEAPDLENFRWAYEAAWEPVVLEGTGEEKVRYVRKVRLAIVDQDDVEIQSIVAMFQDTREGEPVAAPPPPAENP